MKRFHLVELEDLSWWPRLFRDAATDYLVTGIRITKIYHKLVPRLADALKQNGTTQIVDLCSGGGGPWPELLPALRATGVQAFVCLTDKYPNEAAFAKVAATISGIRFEKESVSALDVPSSLSGFRTLFTSFHHFRPTEAKAILAAAVRDRQGIAIAEATSRTWFALLMMFTVPLGVWLMTPRVRPFRWSRLFWTYLIPVLPFFIMFDGIVSCLRIYSPAEMQEMIQELGATDYDWQVGREYPAGSPIPIPYLIGVPLQSAAPNIANGIRC